MVISGRRVACRATLKTFRVGTPYHRLRITLGLDLDDVEFKLSIFMSYTKSVYVCKIINVFKKSPNNVNSSSLIIFLPS